MDIVLTYVNGLDREWQKSYARTIGKPVNEKRFRDWGTLRYLMRGIDKYMPFVKNVYLVVSSESQVPAWAVGTDLKIVLHRDIIPAEYLPTFNSATIEMFLHRIPGLAEEYIYFNDDIYPVSPCKPEDFFEDGKICAKLALMRFSFFSQFRMHTKNSDELARRAAGLKPSGFFRRPQHTCSPMLKSICDRLYRKEEKAILDSVTPVRQGWNVNQYIFTDYMYYRGLTVPHRQSNRHFSLATARLDQICEFLMAPDKRFVCINDVNMPDEKYVYMRKELLDSFRKKFPRKSRFEND